MAQASSSPQEGHNEAETTKKTQTHPRAADNSLPSAVSDSSKLPAPEADPVTLRNLKSCPEVHPKKYPTKDKQDGPRYQGMFTELCQKKEPLSQKHFSPGRKHFQRPSDTSSRSFEHEDHFLACQDLTSRSSQRLQNLEHTLSTLRSRCRVLRGPGACLRGCITGLSSSGETEFYHHPQAAIFSQHYAQLQSLLEERAQLLFLHEYGRRCRAAKCFISRLHDVLGKVHLLARWSSKEHLECPWNLDLRAMCEELQVHVGHWDMLHSRIRSDPFLRTVFLSRTETLVSMQRTLWVLGQQALLLMENCIHTALKTLTGVRLASRPKSALEDFVSAVELYNHILASPRSQKMVVAGRLFKSHCFENRSGVPRKQSRLGAFSEVEVMRIVAFHRGQIAAEQLYSWTCKQTDLLSLAGQNGMKCGDRDFLFVPPTQSKSNVDNSIKKPRHCFCSSSLPLFTFAEWDPEDILQTLFQSLMSSTDLLSPKRPHFDRSPALFSQYRDRLWWEFGKAVIKRFYYPSDNSVLGGMNQWNDQMVFLLVSWLKQACEDELAPAECKNNLNKFYSHILSTDAFTHWDAIMCESLGLGTKDKCLPRAATDPSTVTTATMERTLQLFPPLHLVLQLLQRGHINSGKGNKTLGSHHLGLLCRADAVIQCSSVWVMSKAYQFLGSWSLTKFFLVTQGDLKALRETAEGLVQQLNTAGDHHHHHHHHRVVEHGVQLSRAVSQLQDFSELVLRIFSTDCKKMSTEVFEQTMPSAKHWRVNCKTELSSIPSDYAVFAAQSVLSQVFEGVQPLPDETRIPALSEAVTAFMEAWMEHVLKQKIKFSVHGALQLKRDFDSIRELIRSEKYSLSEELLHRLLSLRVFHQVDNAIVCLLQQPVTKPYIPSQRWEPFRHCCPNRAQVIDQTVGSLNNLDTIDVQAACHQACTRAEGSASHELISTAPPESYLAVAQQEWLDLRIHANSRWRIPGLRCFTKSDS